VRFVWIAGAIVVAGCNQVFGIDPTQPVDASPLPVDAVTRCFADDFEDGAIDPDRWTLLYPAVTGIVSESAGRLLINIPAYDAGRGDVYNGVQSTAFDLTDGTLTTKITPAMTDGCSEIFISLDTGSLATFTMLVGAQNMFEVSVRINNNPQSMVLGAYYPTTITHWRYRHSSATGTIHYEVSRDNGATFEEIYQVATPYTVSGARALLVGGSYQMCLPQARPSYFDDVLHRAPTCVP
jgi:hypothetical protein